MFWPSAISHTQTHILIQTRASVWTPLTHKCCVLKLYALETSGKYHQNIITIDILTSFGIGIGQSKYDQSSKADLITPFFDFKNQAMTSFEAVIQWYFLLSARCSLLSLGLRPAISFASCQKTIPMVPVVGLYGQELHPCVFICVGMRQSKQCQIETVMCCNTVPVSSASVSNQHVCVKIPCPPVRHWKTMCIQPKQRLGRCHSPSIPSSVFICFAALFVAAHVCQHM